MILAFEDMLCRTLLRSAEAFAGVGSGKGEVHSHRPNPIVEALARSLASVFQSALMSPDSLTKILPLA
jgi:hypothetical protein